MILSSVGSRTPVSILAILLCFTASCGSRSPEALPEANSLSPTTQQPSTPVAATPRPPSIVPAETGDANAAPVGTGMIAYVRADTQDEIRVVAPDGSGERLLWSHGVSDPGEFAAPEGTRNITSLAWRPDGSELAFTSSHERECSLNRADLFAVGADGTGYRRVTEAPACPALADYPQGTVQVPVQNPYGSQFETGIYFQGAPGMQRISVPPNGSDVVTFENVADLGEGVIQRAILLEPTDGEERDFGEETGVDVQAGAAVETAPLMLDFPNLSPRLVHAPSWRYDGSKLGYAFNYNSLYQIDPQPAPLQQGELLSTATGLVGLPGLLQHANHLAWAPTAERAGELLYRGEEGMQEGIYLTSEGSDQVGTRLVEIDIVVEEVMAVAWLPDGSGFVYSLLEPSTRSVPDHANLYRYSFESGEVTALTRFEEGDYAGRFSLSPDGQQIVFERDSNWSFLTGELAAPSLWIMALDGSGLRMLVENGRAPAWRP